MSKTNKWQTNINKVVRWASTKNYDVEFHPNNDDEMDEFQKLVTINSRFKPECQLYALLHECGHLLIRKNTKRYNKLYPVAKKLTDQIHKGIAKGRKYQIDVISEEIDAWRIGKNLAKRLNIRIDEDNYNNEMAKYVYSYIEEAYEVTKKKR